jgi:hypothetical protein
MGWKRKRAVEKKDAKERGRKQVGRESSRAEETAERDSVRGPVDAALLLDRRFAHRANAGQRRELLRAGQGVFGNQALQRLLRSGAVQAKLALDPQEGPLERDADQVAEAVTRGPGSQASGQERTAAVTTLAPGLGTVQRAGPRGAGQGQADTAAYRTARIVLEAVMDILEGKGWYHPSRYPNVPRQHWNVIWDFFKAASGKETQNGKWVKAEGRRRRFWVDAGMRRIAPLIAVVEGTLPATRAVVRSKIHGPVAKLREQAGQEEASTLVTKAGRRLAALSPPQQAAAEKRIRWLAKDALTQVRRTLAVVNTIGGAKVDRAFKGVLQENPPPGVLADRLRGVRAAAGLGLLGNILSSVYAVLNIKDHATRRRMFDQRLGTLGYVGTASDLVASVGYATQGVIAGIGLITVAAARAAGQADEAARLIGNLGKVTGGLGRAIGVFNLVKGTLALVNPASTAEERAFGLVDIAFGAGALAAGAVGAGLTAAGLSLSVNLGILRAGVETSRGIVRMGLNRCYRRMAEDGKEIAIYANRILAGEALIRGEQDANRKRHLSKVVSINEFWLRSKLRTLLGAASRFGGNRDPGTYGPLRRRFARCGKPPTRRTSRAKMLAQARLVLKVIERAFADFRQIEVESTREAWKKWG